MYHGVGHRSSRLPSVRGDLSESPHRATAALDSASMNILGKVKGRVCIRHTASQIAPLCDLFGSDWLRSIQPDWESIKAVKTMTLEEEHKVVLRGRSGRAHKGLKAMHPLQQASSFCFSRYVAEDTSRLHVQQITNSACREKIYSIFINCDATLATYSTVLYPVVTTKRLMQECQTLPQKKGVAVRD